MAIVLPILKGRFQNAALPAASGNVSCKTFIFSFLYRLTDRRRQDPGSYSDDPHVFPADKKTDKIDCGDHKQPVQDLKLCVCLVQPIRYIHAVP